MNPNAAVENPAVKVASVWALIGITSWTDVASALAAAYSAALLGEWIWKRVVRPFCEQRGWVRRRARRHDDYQ